MFHPLPLAIGWRYQRGRSGDPFSRFISMLSTAGITIGVMALITVVSVMNGFEQQLKNRILNVMPQMVVSLPMDAKSMPRLPLPEEIARLNQVTGATPLIEAESVLQSQDGLAAAMLLGIDPNQPEPLALYMLYGSLDKLQPRKYQVILGRALARDLNVNVGDKVRIMVTEASQYTPVGRIPSQRNFTVAGLFDTGTDVDSAQVLVNIDDAARLLRYRDAPESKIKGQMSGWRLQLDDPFAVDQLAYQLSQMGYQVKDWRAQRGELFQAVKMEKKMMGLMIGLIVAVAAFNIITALMMVVMEKEGEVAILKTQGMTTREIMTIFMVQGASSGVIGAVVGGLLGTILAHFINPILSTLGANLLMVGGHLPVLIEPSQVALVILLAAGLSLLATIYPSYRAASISPAEALRYE
ncbi:Lipoprotein-releasing system transmembrane protein LolC [Vibrio stylophorae]|uniref:Lipoprotein-releasing system transmembrane protein LolC n=1 Tax=Vibrio stylophorae TaxID=659351 RepID=A0ABM8ZTY9_9VIBR|nr:lipoprotein-releasing ABC transporter permease subunit LolC [Vibrio stylophorae]CAH0533787.1 Lipoprotein-releasing system transmembrane protein LolC [Vibrio stylophorae]